MPIQNDVIVFDLEYTLFGFLFNHSLRTDLPPHLTPFIFEGLKLPYDLYATQVRLPKDVVLDDKRNFAPVYHAIYQSEMGVIFRALLKANKTIAFITRSLLKADLVKRKLEELYRLEHNALDKCLYFNAIDYPQLRNEKFCKAALIQETIDRGLWGKDPKITFVDDGDIVDIKPAKAKPYSYNAITATGQLDPRPFNYALQPTNPIYLQIIILSLHLLEHMPTEEKLLLLHLNLTARLHSDSVSTASMSCPSTPPTGGVVFFREIAPPRTISAVPEGDENAEPKCCWASCRRV